MGPGAPRPPPPQKFLKSPPPPPPGLLSPLELALPLKYSSFQFQQSQKQSGQGGTLGSFNFCSFSKRSCSCNSACRFCLSFDLSARATWALFCSLRFTDLPWPKLRVGTQLILRRSHKGAAVPEWKCWSQTLSLFKIEIHCHLRSMLSSSTSGPWFVTTAGTRHKRIPLAPPLFLEHPTIRHIGILRRRNWKKSRLSTRVGD